MSTNNYSPSRLLAELKAKYGTPAAVLRALGLPADIMAADQLDKAIAAAFARADGKFAKFALRSTRARLAMDQDPNGGDPATLRDAVMNWIQEQRLDGGEKTHSIHSSAISKLLALIDEHAPAGDQSEAEAIASRERPLTDLSFGERDRPSGETGFDEEQVERFKTMLSERGWSPEDVDKAAADFMPKPGTRGGMGGRTSGAMDSMDETMRLVTRIVVQDPPRRAPRKGRAPMGMDERGVSELSRMFPGIEDIQLS